MIKKRKSRTCIAAIKVRNKVMMAADRRSSWDFSQAQTMIKPKILKRNGLILAATGDGYLCSLLVERLDIPGDPLHTDDLDTYMFESLHAHITKLLLRKGFKDGHNQLSIPGEDSGCELLVGVKGRLFNYVISNPEPENKDRSLGEIQVDELNLPYASGCGGALAWGSLLTTDKVDMKPKDRLTLALEVAAHVSPGCDNNIDIVGE